MVPVTPDRPKKWTEGAKTISLRSSGDNKGTVQSVFLQDQNFWGPLMTPCLKFWGSLANLEGQNFFNV